MLVKREGEMQSKIDKIGQDGVRRVMDKKRG